MLRSDNSDYAATVRGLDEFENDKDEEKIKQGATATATETVIEEKQNGLGNLILKKGTILI